MTPKEVDQLLKVLKKHGVEKFKSGDLELSISPLKYSQNAYQPQDDKVTEEDLYYSATPIKSTKQRKQ